MPCETQGMQLVRNRAASGAREPQQIAQQAQMLLLIFDPPHSMFDFTPSPLAGPEVGGRWRHVVLRRGCFFLFSGSSVATTLALLKQTLPGTSDHPRPSAAAASRWTLARMRLGSRGVQRGEKKRVRHPGRQEKGEKRDVSQPAPPPFPGRTERPAQRD